MTPTVSSVPSEILIVDDDPANLDLLAHLFKMAGHHVRAAPSPELALQSALSFPPELIILDVRMPGMDGFEVARRLKKDPGTANVPIVFISGYTEVADRVMGFEVGGVDFITKPFQRDEVLARVQTHLALRRALDEIGTQNRHLETTVQQRTTDLRHERDLAQSYLDITPVMLLALDKSGRISMINRRGADILGCSVPSMIGLNWFESFVPATERLRRQQGFAQSLTGDILIPEGTGSRVTAADGQERLIFFKHSLLHDEAGHVIGSLSSGEDVTELRQIENALFISEEKHRSYIENAPDGIFVADALGRYLDVNPAACTLTGYSREELLGMTIAHLAPSGERLAHLDIFAQAVQQRGMSTELRIRQKQGAEILISLKAAVLSGGRVMGFCSDITQQRRTEQQAIARAEELDSALKQLHSLSAHMHDSIEKERMVIASDIHDQIGASLTGANLLLNQVNTLVLDLPQSAREVLVQVQEIVSQTLTSSRGVYTRLRPPMLNDLGLAETCRWYLQDWAKKSGIKVKYSLFRLSDEPPESIRLDIFRILQELLTNVARHSGATQVSVSLTQSKNCAHLKVKDNGQGFDPEGLHEGFGLRGIRGRLNRRNGSLDIDRVAPGVGVSVQIPLNNGEMK